jgi:hypothetical protein
MTINTSNQSANAKQVTFQDPVLPSVVIPSASTKYTMISEKIPGIEHPINAWLKANYTEKLQLLSNNAGVAGMLVLTKHNQALLPVVAPTKPQSLIPTSKMIVNFGNEANKIHPVNIYTKDTIKFIIGIMTKEDVKSCKFEYEDDIDLREPLKVTAADGSEKIWSLAKLPEDDDQEDDNDPNDTPGKPKLVMVAISKAFPFAYEDDSVMGPFGHEDIETAAQSVDGKLLIIIRALAFLAKYNDGNSFHKITNFAWNYFPVLKQKFEQSTSKSIYTELESLQPDVPDHKIMEMKITNAQILLQAKLRVQNLFATFCDLALDSSAQARVRKSATLEPEDLPLLTAIYVLFTELRIALTLLLARTTRWVVSMRSR